MDPLLITLIIVAGLVAGGVVLIPIFFSVSSLYPYAYTNARIRAMRSKLITHEQLEDYLKRPYTDIIYSLEKHTYPQLSKYLESDFTYAAIDTALRTSLVNTLAKVKKIAPDSSKKIIKVVLSKYDIQIIETIVRSSNVKLSSVADVLHVSEVFSKEFLMRKHHTLESLHNELKGSVYEQVLVKHMDELRRGEYLKFEIEMDLLYCRRLLKAAKSREARTYAKKLIDRYNISLVLKGLEPIIPGGAIPLDEFSLKDSLEDLSKKLHAHGYLVTASTKEGLERQLQARHMRAFAESLFARNPLSEASLIGFIILKSMNARNLNILLKMKYHNFPEEKIREVLAL